MPTAKQIAVVHLAAKELGLDDDTYRAVLKRWGGVTSSKDLDQGGFEKVMAYFTACGFRSTWTRRTFGKRPGRASPAQTDLIRKLWREWSGDDDELALNAWLDRSYHIAALRFVTPEIAKKAIEGLKIMVRRKQGAA
ncbi:MAG: regulatory protein GemA [Pseudomonadota bacterium]